MSDDRVRIVRDVDRRFCPPGHVLILVGEDGGFYCPEGFAEETAAWALRFYFPTKSESSNEPGG